MNKQRKKGFTVTELVIVIAIIAILAAVLIPTFASLIKKANTSADIQTVRNLNTIVTAEGALNDGIKTAHDAIVAASENGYDLEHITPTEDGRTIVWDGANYCFALLTEDDGIIYPDTEVRTVATPNANLFVVSDTYPAADYDGYGVYLTEECTLTEVNATTGVDVGYNTEITSVTYTGTENVIIRTNTETGTVVINNSEAEVDWYGVTYMLDVKDAAMSSVHVYGNVLCQLVITKGNVVVEPGAEIATIYVTAASASDYKLEVKSGAKVGMITADKAGVLGDINVPDGVGVLEYTEGAVVYSATTGEAYTSLSDAIEKTASGGTITLLDDSTVGGNYVLTNKDITINLNNQTLTSTAYYGFYMGYNTTNITLENGTINSTNQIAYGTKGKITLNNVKAKVTSDAAFWNYGYVLTIDESSVIEHACSDYAAVQVKDTATVHVYGTIDAPSSTVFQNNGTNKTSTAVINVYDGAVINGGACISYLPAPVTFNIYGGTMTARSGLGMKSGSLNIYGGTIHTTGTNDKQEGLAPDSASSGISLNGSVIQIDSHLGYAGNMRIDIMGGTLISDNSYILCETGNLENTSNIVSLHIGGGSFTSKYGNILVTTPAEENVVIDVEGVTRVEPIENPIKKVDFSNRYTIPASVGTFEVYKEYEISVLEGVVVDGVNILEAFKAHYTAQGLNLTEEQWATVKFAAGSTANQIKTIWYDSTAQ